MVILKIQAGTRRDAGGSHWFTLLGGPFFEGYRKLLN